MKQQLAILRDWYTGLQPREKILVLTTSVVMAITLFYLIVWEPVYQSLEHQQQRYESQREILAWMQSASVEASILKRSGARPTARSNQPVSLIIEQSAATAGLKQNMDKLESSGESGARAIIETASFDQMLIWLNTLQQHHGVIVTSANIERADKPGTVNARLSFSKS